MLPSLLRAEAGLRAGSHDRAMAPTYQCRSRVKGKIKESVGRLISNPNLEGEGIGP
jgi:hypothetical protein